MLVQCDLLTKKSGIGHIACKDKDTERLSILCHIVFELTCRVIAKIRIGDHRFTADPLDNSIEPHFDIRVVRECIHGRLRCPKLIAAHENGHRLTIT